MTTQTQTTAAASTINHGDTIGAHLARLSELLPSLADRNSVSEDRRGAMIAAYRAAEHLYDLAEELASGAEDGAADVDMALRGAAGWIDRLQRVHGIETHMTSAVRSPIGDAARMV